MNTLIRNAPLCYYRYEGGGKALYTPHGFIKGREVSQYVDTRGVEQVSGICWGRDFVSAEQLVRSAELRPVLGGAVTAVNTIRAGTLHISGILDDGKDFYNIVNLAMTQQAQTSGDSCGATLLFQWNVGKRYISIQFERCTVASIEPIRISQDDATHSITWNYLNWKIDVDASEGALLI